MFCEDMSSEINKNVSEKLEFFGFELDFLKFSGTLIVSVIGILMAGRAVTGIFVGITGNVGMA